MTEVSAALRDLEVRLSQDPDNLLLRVRVATLLRQVGRNAEAARLLRSVALAYRDRGRYAEAVAIARSLLEIVPADTAIHTLVDELEHRDDDITATRDGVAANHEATFIEPSAPAGPTSDRAQSASLAALIARPRIPSRPPPLRAVMGPPTTITPASEDTPLPGALPYHIAEPSTPASRVPFGVRGVRVEPSESSRVTGLAEAARRISGLIALDGESEDSFSDLGVSPRVGAASPQQRDGAAAARDFDHGRVGPMDEEPTSPREIAPLAALAAVSHLSSTVASDPLANAFFASLSEADRAMALQKFETSHVPAGSIVIRQGALAQPLIAVVRGRLELRVERANHPDTILDTIEAGAYIGEAALLGRASAPAHVITVVDCDLLMLAPHALFELATMYPALWAALKDSAERRTRRYDSIIRALP